MNKDKLFPATTMPDKELRMQPEEVKQIVEPAVFMKFRRSQS